MNGSGFGILDIRPNELESPPEFSEPATVQAMANLGLEPIDLVCPDFANSRLEVAIELERRRIEAIQRIIAERDRIFVPPQIDPPAVVHSTPRPKPRKPPKPRIPRLRRRDDRALPLRIQQKENHIRQRARERMELVMQEQKAMIRRMEQQREERRRQQLHEERRIQRLRELKRREYEKEREKRQTTFLRVRRSRNPRTGRTIRGLFDDTEAPLPDLPVAEPDTEAPPPDLPVAEPHTGPAPPDRPHMRRLRSLFAPTGSE